ncbi:MAG: M81 family metallopeptidase [Isosphaeraceae bacterium]|nr:M81 family metallopeptidase [Isosphaeraceae bacterium]
MRIAIGGIMHESNTFASLRTGWRQFQEGSLTRGEALLATWREAHHELGGFIAGADRFGYELVPTVMAWATPSGPVEEEVLDEVVAEIIAGIERGRADGLLLALHGALVTPAYADADGEVLRRLRAAIGPERPIVATLDYHANVSPVMVEHADALIGYQTYPHVDQRPRGLFAAELLARTLRGEVRPASALAKPPMVINLLGQETDREPMRSLMALARAIERRPGPLSVSVMAGFPYADVPEMGPAVIAVADGDRALAQAAASELADRMWEARRELFVPCPSPEEAVRRAIASDRRPVVLVDLGDNIGGGSAGDGTVLLAELLRQRAQGAVVVLYDPEGVQAAREAGPGGRFERLVGGRVDRLHGDPILVRGEVRSLHEGTWIEDQARHGGRRLNDQGPTAVLTIEGPNTLVLNSLRTPPFSLGQLTSLGIDPARQAILVVKAAIAYKAAYGPIAGEVIAVDTPGLTAIDPSRFAYQRIRRPMFPLDP